MYTSEHVRDSQQRTSPGILPLRGRTIPLLRPGERKLGKPHQHLMIRRATTPVRLRCVRLSLGQGKRIPEGLSEEGVTLHISSFLGAEPRVQQVH